MTIDHIADLKPDRQNARKHNPRNVGMIAAALQEVGAARSIVIDEDGNILAGNGTVEAAAQVGIERVKVVEADGETIVAVRRTGLSAEAKQRLALYDNRTAELADWDTDVLAGLRDEGDALDGLFFDDELDALLASVGTPEPGDGGDDFDTTPQDGPTRVQPGDLWRIGQHRLLCGDATRAGDVARLMGGEKAQAVVTDPPYGTGIKAVGGLGNSSIPFNLKGDGDTQLAKDAYTLWCHEADMQVWWGANYYADGLPPSSCWLVWDKDHHGMTFADAELAWVSKAGPVRVFRHAWSGNHRASEQGVDRDHPTQKPIALLEWVLKERTRKGDVVGDPFLGSGTTLIAAHRTGRRCYGMEIEPKYCDVILRRAEAEGIGPIELEGNSGT